MGKLTNYIIFLSVMIILFYAFGLLQNTPISILLTWLLNPQNIWTSSLYDKVVIALTGAALIGATVIGYYVTQSTEWVIKAVIMLVLLEIGFDLIVIFRELTQINTFFATLVISPLVIVYVLTIVEWGGGHD